MSDPNDWADEVAEVEAARKAGRLLYLCWLEAKPDSAESGIYTFGAKGYPEAGETVRQTMNINAELKNESASH